MSGLVLKLAPKERVLINGAIIENGDRRSRLSIVTPNANILRLKDAIPEEEATTPVRQLCVVAQQVLAGETTVAAGTDALLAGLAKIETCFAEREARDLFEIAQGAVERGQAYQALKALRRLIPYEDAVHSDQLQTIRDPQST